MSFTEQKQEEVVKFSLSADLFQKLTFAASQILECTNLQFFNDKLQLIAMDSSHVTLIHVELQQDDFEYFKCTTPIIIGINFESLQKVLKFSRPGDVLNFQYTKNTDVVHLNFTPVQFQSRIMNF